MVRQLQVTQDLSIFYRQDPESSGRIQKDGFLIRIDPGFRMVIGRVIGKKLCFHAGKGKRTVIIRIFIRSRRAVFIRNFIRSRRTVFIRTIIRKYVNTEGVCQGLLCQCRVIAVVDGRGCISLPTKLDGLGSYSLLSLSILFLKDALSDQGQVISELVEAVFFEDDPLCLFEVCI